MNNNDILSKFDNIEVNSNSRISEGDKIFCEENQKQYSESIKIQLDFLNTFKEVSGIDLLAERYTSQESKNKFLDWYKFDKIADLAKETKAKFIHEITWYFQRQYNITIDSKKIIEKYDFDVTYENIIDEIFVQLEGYSFEEKAVKEIKDELKEQVKGYNKINVIVKNKKVMFPNFFYIDSFDVKYGTYKVNYSSDSAFSKLLTAISHFEQGVTHNNYQGIYRKITDGRNDEVFTTHGLMCFKAESIKLFKNGKVEVAFINSQNALKFAKEYCGYIGEQQKTA
jgi:hypothetical protein